ncbi:Spc98 family-domain-containing protein [Circinella umbellata]|nr:Spc98 family-domain-containing protein [Circinella umbellata]
MIRNEITPLDFALSGSLAFYRDVCLGLLRHTSIPYLTMLSQWLGLSNKKVLLTDDNDNDDDPIFHDWKDIMDEAPLRDPYQEFFLYDINQTKESLVDRFQSKKQDELPYFLNSMQAGVILRTGNALQLLRRFQPEHPLCCVEKETLNQGDLMLRWMPLEAQSHRYINRLHAFTRQVRQYNENKNIPSDNKKNNTLLAKNNNSRDETESMDIEMNQEKVEQEYKVPTLKALDQEIKLVSDFHKTLDTILLCHQRQQQQQQQPADNNDSDQDNKFGYIPVVQTITDQSVHQPLAIWCPLVNESAMKLFTEKFHIQAHFELIRRFFLFGDDRFSNAIKDALFINNNDNKGDQDGYNFVVGGIKLHHNNNSKNNSGIQWPPRTSDLNMALRAVLLESLAQIPEEIKGYICKTHNQLLLDQDIMDIEDLLTFGVREKQQNNQWRDPYKINALDFLYLQYQVPYPLNMIINDRTLDKYNRMFTFLLQLQRIDAITKYIYQKLPAKTDKSNLLQHRIRFQVAQFAATLCQYVFDTAIHNTWHSFIQRIQDQDDKLFKTMDPIMFGEYHEHVLDRMLYQCFLKQSQQPIKHMLNQVLQDIIILTTTLMTDKHDDQQVKLEQEYEQYMEHTHQFIKVLSKLHERGIGRLGNVMNSHNLQGSFGVFGDFHDKLDAKSGQGAFAQELLIRLDMNGHYINYASTFFKKIMTI